MAMSADKATPLNLITDEHFGKKVGLSISTLQNSFFTILTKGIQDAAQLFGMELMVFDAHNQDAQQLTDIVNALSRKVDFLVLNPTNTESIAPGIELANNNEIPVITVDRKVSSGKVLCHIESDNYNGGKMAAEALARILNYKGRVLEIEGIPGTSASLERGTGFNHELAKFQDMKIAYREVAGFDREQAEAATHLILDQGGQFDGVFAHNDNMILGVIDAFEKSGKKLPKALIGFDAIPEAQRSIKQGKLTATIAQKPSRMGWLAIKTAARYFRGEDIAPTKLVELNLIRN
jgi:ABC-type sugar transport system substrate-binding protein